jgi:lipopolysaccharide exporter
MVEMSTHSSDPTLTPESSSVAGRVRRGLAWSTLNQLALRLGSLSVGIVLARLLAPEAFGVYAIGLTVQAVLLTLADLGMSVDLVRSEDADRRAPTVATLSLASSVVLALTMTVTAEPVASLMGAPNASGVIALLAWTLVIGGAGVVPYAKLQRDFRQRALFASSLGDFVVGTTVTIGLVLLGVGPIALAIGRVIAQFTATGLQFRFAGVRPRFGFDREIARSALAFGLPLAGANLLSWALINIDNVAISRIAGPTALGLYVLAFNVSSWPMTAIGQAVRSVSLAAFSKSSASDAGADLKTALGLTWAAALPVGVLLAALAHPLVLVLYGERWSPSATVLAALGMFGGLRVVLDLVATYLMARGAARPVLYVQILWFLALVPAMIVATHWKGIAGAGWSHLAVGLALIVPAYAVALRKVGVPVSVIFRATWLPTLAGVPTWYVAHALAAAIDTPLLALAAGGLAGLIVYLAISYRWILGQLPARAGRRRRRAPRLVERPQPEGIA